MTPTDLHPNDDGAVVRPADPWRRERVLVVGVVMALVFFRCFVLVFFEGSSFDSDQALIGLMAKHLVEGRAFPVFTYGQPYMLGVEAWMAAPFFLVGGTTVTMLKLPLLLVNLAVGVILVLLAERELRLRPALALVPALFFVLMAPGTSTLLLQASGGNVEPFLYVLLLWVLRRRPLAFGAVLAFGVLQREFTIYAFGATAALALFDRSLFRRANWQPIALGLVAFCATWQGIYLLKQYSSIDGPGTSVDRVLSGGSGNVEALLGRVCVDPGRALDGLSRLAPRYAADLFGAHPRPLGDFQINSFVYQGTSWLGILLLIGFVLATLRVAWLLWRRRLAPWHPAVWFATYLWLIGLQAGLGHVALRCGEVSIPTMRYSLLAVFGAVGLVGAHLALEPSRRLRAVAVVLTLVWAGVSFMGYARLTAEYAWHRPPDERRLLADYMVEHGIRYARANFWDALHITFYTDERAIVASTTNVFLYEYQWVVGEQAGDVPTIARDRCPGGIRVARAYYLCPPGEP
jgi:hypothetical protein